MSENKEFINGFAIVEQGGKKNYINMQGELLSNIWFSSASPFTKEGLAFVWLDGMTNVINSDGEFLLKKRYQCIQIFGNVIIGNYVHNRRVSIDVLNRKGEKIISRKILKYVTYIKEGYILLVDKELNKNVIDKTGKVLFNNWYFSIQPVKFTRKSDQTYFLVGKYNSRGKRVYNLLDKEEKGAFSRKWFESIFYYTKGEKVAEEALVIGKTAKVAYDGKRYLWHLNSKNNLTEIK